MVDIYTDGSSIGNPGPGGASFVVVQEDSTQHSFSKHLGVCTNNFAEYTAVIYALEYFQTIDNQELTIWSDSLLVINQVNGLWKVKNANIIPLYASVNKLIKSINSKVKFVHIKAHKGHVYNELADTLANSAARSLEN